MDIYRRGFFKCQEDDCGFMLSLLGGQANFEIHSCPSCQEGSIDYATKQETEDYLKELKSEITYMSL